MSQTQTFIGTLVIEECCNCGIAFGITQDLYQRRRDDHATFWCPKGHPQHYTGKSEAEKLREEVQRLETSRTNLYTVIENKNNQIAQLNYSVRAQKAANTKIINRVKNGNCPCCKRTFINLQEHFLTKHPELFEGKKELPGFHKSINKRSK